MSITIETLFGVFTSPLVRVESPAVRYYVVWDDQNPDYNYRCRTQMPDWEGVDNPPAVYRYYNVMRDQAGDFRVNLDGWRDAIVRLNGGDERKFDYLVGSERALYNQTGWPMQAYITMSSNVLQGEQVGNWFRFVTLKPSDVGIVAGMTIATHPQFVHRFTCVTWDRETKTTRHINSTGTPRGDVFYFLVTNEGYGFIPIRHVAMG